MHARLPNVSISVGELEDWAMAASGYRLSQVGQIFICGGRI